MANGRKSALHHVCDVRLVPAYANICTHNSSDKALTISGYKSRTHFCLLRACVLRFIGALGLAEHCQSSPVK